MWGVRDLMYNTKRRPSSNRKECEACKEAVISSTRIYCERLGEYVDNLVYCPYFDPKQPTAKIHAIQ